MQRFISIDIANSGDEGLVEQQRFEYPAAAAELILEPGRRECVRKGFGSQFAYNGVGIGHQVNAAKFAYVAEAQFVTICQSKKGMHVFIGRNGRRLHA